jgi:triphosphatase
VRIVWHDSPAGELAKQGLACAEQRSGWRLERLRPDSAPWPPAAPPPTLVEAKDRGELARHWPQIDSGALMPWAAFEGRSLTFPLEQNDATLSVSVLSGDVRTLATERPIARLMLAGPPAATMRLAEALVDELRLAVPTASLAGEALGFARDARPSARQLGAPRLATGLTVAEAFAAVASHLTDVILYWGSVVAEGVSDPEPVHQMRVAVRRLRSALSIFGDAASGPAIERARAGLKTLGGVLGPARDWDVFVTETCLPVGSAFAKDQSVTRLLAAAERRRTTSYAALRGFLSDVAFRRLGLELASLAYTAILREGLEGEAALDVELREFAGRVLDRRLKRLLEPGDDLLGLPADALHAVRLHGKRMRYATEFFAAVFPGKGVRRFLEHLTDLQERLGQINDGAVAEGLLGELGLSREHGHAAGVIRGFIAARRDKGSGKINRAWAKFRCQDPFWA